ncbi:MAG: transposase [Azospirillum sp.]|nr:transposase [Azospirillum sp.]
MDGPERRRRWSDEEKSKILEELAQPGVRSADVARRCGVSRSLLYAWRKDLALATGPVSAPTPGMAFAPVLLAGPAVAPSSEAAALETPMIEIEVKGARVRLPGSAPSSMVAAAIKALRGRS